MTVKVWEGVRDGRVLEASLEWMVGRRENVFVEVDFCLVGG